MWYQAICNVHKFIRLYVAHINVVSGRMPYDLYSSPNITGVIKSIRIRWVGHVARMGERRGAHRVGGGT